MRSLDDGSVPRRASRSDLRSNRPRSRSSTAAAAACTAPAAVGFTASLTSCRRVDGCRPPPRIRRACRLASTRRSRREERYQHIHARASALGRADLTGIEVIGSRLERLDLAFADASQAVLRDCVFDRGDAANATARSAALTRVQFKGVRMTGAQLIDCALLDVVFHEVKLDLAGVAVRQAAPRRVPRLQHDRRRLHRRRHPGRDIRRLRPVRCAVLAGQGGGARFEKCWLEGIGGVADLRGAAIRSDDLVSLSKVFALALGIDIVG